MSEQVEDIMDFIEPEEYLKMNELRENFEKLNSYQVGATWVVWDGDKYVKYCKHLNFLADDWAARLNNELVIFRAGAESQQAKIEELKDKVSLGCRGIIKQQREIDELKKQLKYQGDSLTEEVEFRLSIEEENTKQQAEIETLTARVAVAEGANVELNEEVKTYKATLTEQLKYRKEDQELIDTLKAENEELHKACNDYKMMYTDKMAENKKLRAIIENCIKTWKDTDCPKTAKAVEDDYKQALKGDE